MNEPKRITRLREYSEEPHDEPCTYGHFHCARTEGGPCGDEAAADVAAWEQVQ